MASFLHFNVLRQDGKLNYSTNVTKWQSSNLMENLKKSVFLLYHGQSKRAVLFRYTLLCFDIVTIGFFIASSMVAITPVVLIIDYCIAAILIFDFLLRLWISKSKRDFFFQIRLNRWFW